MGLLSVLPSCTSKIDIFPKNLFLRAKLLYPEYWSYYLAIPLDFILRFSWVVSLMPASFVFNFAGPTLAVCLGMLEILRRSMWSHFRVEMEHIKFLSKNHLGFLDIHQHESRKDLTTKALRDIAHLSSCAKQQQQQRSDKIVDANLKVRARAEEDSPLIDMQMKDIENKKCNSSHVLSKLFSCRK
jgi:hypothetical protein